MDILIYTKDYIVENEIDKVAYGFIYITTNLINGKKYIGQKKFLKGWKSYYGSGVHYKNSEKLYGKDNFSREIIDIANNQEELNELEVKYIDMYDAAKSKEYYNIADGGKSGNTFAGKTEEEMAEISEKMSKSGLGRIFTEDQKRKISISNSGNKRTESQINNMRLSRIGLYCGKENPFYGKHHTEETKKNISALKKGVPLSKEHKLALSNSRFGENNPKSKKLICLNTNEIFDCIKYASKKYNVHYSSIVQCCRGKLKSAGKHPETGEKLVWMYYEDYKKLNNKED